MIDPLIMLSIGAALCVLELFLMNFVLLFFGLGFIIIGALNFIIDFEWQWQILASFLLSFVLLFSFKKPLNRLFHKSSDKYKDNFLDESGVGEIKQGMVYFKGTLWQSDDIDLLLKNGLKDGDKVKILCIKDGKVVVER
ncbi:NfeD family protein [Campylobacter sp. FMV-PI01]|uniref:NfeD family protein n=1 Tax=Campylobacter portucalensis TaxID=2608384 RepID=A0A6L5WLK0_9BACT|nr:NfeD family protein [Campylobacter portucalensis]MSN96571.1 NfeD family protein [Campylobacter portucalensis]